MHVFYLSIPTSIFNFKSMVAGVAGRPGIRVALRAVKVYSAEGGLVTTPHHRQMDNIASGTARSTKPALTYSATVLLLIT